MDETAFNAEDDARALRQRRAELREFASEIAEAIEDIDLPETYLDGERAVRMIRVADVVLMRVTRPDQRDTIRPARQRLRDQADLIVQAVRQLPKPTDFLEGERAGRFILATERLWTQLYAPPKPLTSAQLDELEREAELDKPMDSYGQQLYEKLLAMKYKRDAFKGYFDDGSPFDPNRPQIVEDGDAMDKAEATGFWPDGAPYDPDRPSDNPAAFRPPRIPFTLGAGP
ncbi:hypothetical protein [Asticcacaulis sp. YBE204]|uniref:hypothetical protein n=1 Tax=Asticcacaulis sp. YBE204 TaxID=1282363 RepID=UPI0003C3E069|nr:hypothetical protein [Asticcacaulis sp. YBE204]ESQ78213.1 hypothetical protein AEYBE204_15360 [Asticcacaulis sp. YBE204]